MMMMFIIIIIIMTTQQRFPPPSILMTEVPLSKASNPSCSPGAAAKMAAHCSGCVFMVCVFTNHCCVCALGWVNPSAQCSCGSVVEHCVSSAKGCGFDSQGTHILIKKKNVLYSLNAL